VRRRYKREIYASEGVKRVTRECEAFEREKRISYKRVRVRRE
jgi:hypothetical protein